MKNILLLFFLIVTISMNQAQMSPFRTDSKALKIIDQSSIECIYKYTVVSTKYTSESHQFTADFLELTEQTQPIQSSENKIIEEHLTILQTNNSVSKFWDFHPYLKDSLIYCSKQQLSSDSIRQLEKKYKYWVNNQFIPVIFKNYPEGKITETNEITFYDYIYEEALPEIEWTISDDTTTVSGYPCQKAVGKYCGREWIVWFTPEIAISNGPWKLSGLPGLILKATDLSGIHTFESFAIRTSNHPIYIAKNSQMIKTNKKKFLNEKAKAENIERPSSELSIMQLPTITYVPGVNNNTMYINGKMLKHFKTTVYSPLELE